MPSESTFKIEKTILKKLLISPQKQVQARRILFYRKIIKVKNEKSTKRNY